MPPDPAVAFLLERRDRDGLWRDYALPPGRSECWTTSVAALAIARHAPAEADRARAAVAARARPGGWGYNSSTACDADSTAWAVRLLRRGAGALSGYLDARGRAHTFADPGRFGTWAEAHADVTPVAGLAVVACGGPGWIVDRIRSACLAGQGADGGWRSFWWTSDAYATARSLELLEATGGVPRAVAARARAWLAAEPLARDAFDAAARLDVAGLVGGRTASYARDLLGRRERDGGWPASPALLVPDQATGERGAPHADDRRILTTAAALLALRRQGTRRGDARSPRASRGRRGAPCPG